MNDLIAGLTGLFDISDGKLIFSGTRLGVTALVVVGAAIGTAALELGLDAMHGGIEKEVA